MFVRRIYTVVVAGLLLAPAMASDWSRFRGPDGTGVSKDSGAIPTTWSDTENLQWKTKLPGPGLSSPIVVGDRVYVTSWTGYEAGPGSSDDQADLKRALVCIDRNSGDILWTESVDAVLPEDDFQGMFAENGYASHTPACDGEHIYCFFGKSGVVAFDLEGNQKWQTSVGTGLDPRRWGSASSPILYDNLVIVTAAAESESLVALDKATGKEVWREEAPTLTGTWSTPVLVPLDDERTDLVISVPGEVWGLNPSTGKLRWYCVQPGGESSAATASVVVSEGPEPIAIVLGGRDNGSMAVRVGGKGDVTDTHMVWEGRERASIGTPILQGNRLFWVSRGIANCINAETHEEIYKERLGGGGGGRGVRGGDYSSPIVADGKMIFIRRGGDAYVLKPGDEFEVLAVNRFESDTGEYSATPAVSDGQLFIRSTDTLYCVSNS